MADKEQQLTPEEKLLKVIQGSGTSPEGSTEKQTSKKAASVPPPSAAKTALAAAAKAAMATTDEGKPKLKVAKPDSDLSGDGKAPGKRLIGVTSPTEAPSGASQSVVMKPSSQRAWIPVINRALAFAAALVLLLTAFDVWGSIRAKSKDLLSKVSTVPSVSVVQEPSKIPALDLNAALAEMARPNVFGVVSSEPQPPTTLGPGHPEAPKLATRLKFMGVSQISRDEQEVIICDTGDDKRMFFVKAGEKIVVGDQQLELVEVQGDQAILSDGRSKLTINGTIK